MRVDNVPDDFNVEVYRYKDSNITVEKCGQEDDSWAVRDCGFVWSREVHWEFEPLPSNRGDDFIKKTRFHKEDAFEAARVAFQKTYGGES